jgi:hypothetical protein
MAVQKFEDLLVWQKSQDLTIQIYKAFQDNKDFSFKDQIAKSARCYIYQLNCII